MFKKLLKAGMTLALLWGCYVAYGHAFKLVVQQFRTYRSKEDVAFRNHPSKSKLEAIALAKLVFGNDHWSVTNGLAYAYYNSERGFWTYALEYEEVQEENGVRYDGKRLKFKPFAMIFESSDGKKHQTLTADRATLDLNQPVGLSSGRQGAEPMKIMHALIEGNVCVRDDRGTPTFLPDDLNVGPMTHLVFDEEKQQITTDSHVVMQDKDQTTVGDGMLIQMRKKDPNAAAGQSSSGFEGAEYLILYKNPRVVLRDVGNSGVMPGSSSSKKPQKEAVVKVRAGTGGSVGKKDQPAAPEEPSPLVIMSEGPMRVDFAKNRLPVEEGPPEPPAPTRVRFDRNVVALQTHPGRQPDQLNCDTLRLTLIPADKPPTPNSANGAPVQGGGSATAQVDPGKAPARLAVNSLARSEVRGAEVRAEPKARVAARSDAGAAPAGANASAPPAVDPSAESSSSANSGPFGNLTLQKAHATGHAVWLQLREQGVKVLCVELIHERRAPYEPDRTYFRGDTTRQVWIEKIDREPVEAEDAKTGDAAADRTVAEPGMLARGRRSASPPKQGKITGVTHIMTLDATLFDMSGVGGGDMDLSDIVARGPGKLESRPDLKEPVERIAVWQDELTIHNILGPKSELVQKQITLTGTRPYFVDTVKKASVDSNETLILWLVPKTKKEPATSSPSLPTQPGSDAFAVANVSADGVPSAGKKTSDDSGGGGLQLERLEAFPDGRFRAPGKNIEARHVLDVHFVEAEPAPIVASTTPAAPDGPVETAATPATEPAPGNQPAKADGQAPTAVAATSAEPKPSTEPTMNGVADRIWAKVALKPGSELDPSSNGRRSRTAAKPTGTPGNSASIVAAQSADAPASGSGDSDSDVREAWLWGNVTLHQESPPEKPENEDGTKAKPKTQDVRGEAVYMDNYRGKGMMIARVYNHNPNEPPRPRPWPLAMVATDEKTIRSTLIRMDQGKDMVWCDGPGELTQLTERSLFTDKKEEPNPETDSGAPAAADPGAVASAPDSSPGGGNRIRTATGSITGSALPRESPPKPQPKTRGGRPISDKDLLTITWTDHMEFTGRSTDPTTKLPAGKAEFFGFPNAMMEDAQLKCDERMIVYTDREVPLGELGSISTGTNKPGGASGAAKDGGDAGAKDQSAVDIALIYCFGKSVAVTRKMYPDVPAWLEQNMIYAEHRLDYNRRTGEFIVPGKGRVYKYERKNESEKTSDGDGPNGESPKAPDAVAGRTNSGRTNTGRSTAARRTVTPTSGRTASGAAGTAGPDRTTASAERRSPRTPAGGNAAQVSQPATPPVSRTIPPLVLTQIFFTKGMQGQIGTGQANDTTQDRTAILFGDIQLRNAQVNSVDEAFNFDQPLTDEGFYLTSQILRLIQEPPLPGAPAGTPTRSFIKAWDDVIVNKGQSMVIDSDVGTYDSGTDVLYAYGEGDREVMLAEQYAVGQPASPAFGKALRFNVKTGAAQFVNSDTVQLFDKRTGARPPTVGPPDPNVRKPGKRGTPFMVPNNNLERRGFTAQ